MRSQKYFFILVLFCGLIAFSQSCTTNNTPSSPVASTATPTPTTSTTPTASPTSTPTNAPIIAAVIGAVFSPQVSVCVADSTGNTGIANTSVTLITQGVSTPLTYVGIGPVYVGNPSNVGLPAITGGQYNNSITYVPGQVYEVDVTTNGSVYSSSITALDGSPQVSALAGNAGVVCSWNNGIGNEDFILVNTASTSNQTGPPLADGPTTLSNSLFSGETPGDGQYQIILGLIQANPGFPGCQASSRIATIQSTSLHY